MGYLQDGGPATDVKMHPSSELDMVSGLGVLAHNPVQRNRGVGHTSGFTQPQAGLEKRLLGGKPVKPDNVWHCGLSSATDNQRHHNPVENDDQNGHYQHRQQE
jgi:hypothetical protein